MRENCAGVILPFVRHDWLSWSNHNMAHKENWLTVKVGV